MDQERFSTLFYLLHKNGDKLFPVRMKNRDTGKICFRVSPGGTGGNKKEMGLEIECEQEMKNFVLQKGYTVRASTKDGTRKGLYKAEQRCIVSVVE
jgi:hypothetical protein